MKYDDLFEPLAEIARRAGDAILEVYAREDFDVSAKSDDSPLTEADRRANRIICDALREQYPDIPIISEENKQLDYEERKNWNRCWMVDPLDGTKEFVRRNGEFTVNIALIEEGRSVFGVVYIPVAGRLYLGAKGMGSFEVSDSENHQLTASRYALTDEGLVIVGSRSHMNDLTKNFILSFQNPEIVARGSSLKFLTIAEGNAHIYPRLAPTMEWDTAAAQIILEEAGGSVIDRETQQPLQYNKANLLNPHFIASGTVV